MRVILWIYNNVAMYCIILFPVQCSYISNVFRLWNSMLSNVGIRHRSHYWIHLIFYYSTPMTKNMETINITKNSQRGYTKIWKIMTTRFHKITLSYRIEDVMIPQFFMKQTENNLPSAIWWLIRLVARFF